MNVRLKIHRVSTALKKESKIIKYQWTSNGRIIYTERILFPGVGVMMLLALTVERYVSVCRPGQHTRPLCGPPHLTVALIPLATFLVYLPNVFREEVATCLLALGGPVIYQKRENHSYLDSLFYQVIKTFCYFEFWEDLGERFIFRYKRISSRDPLNFFQNLKKIFDFLIDSFFT